MNRLTRLIGVGVVGTAALALPSMALAAHTHVIHTGNSDCVVLAQNGKENMVQLPDAVFENNPNVTLNLNTNPPRHPLHVLVHKGKPGAHNTIQVLGSDTCEGFVNP